MAVALILVGIPAIAEAQVVCTIQWDGGAGTASWHDPANWDAGGVDRLPAASDHVCIGQFEGLVVVHRQEVVTEIASLRSDSPLQLSTGSLAPTDTLVGSTITQLHLDGGTLAGAASVALTGSSRWSAGAMSGPGTTVIPTGGELSITGDGGKSLSGGRVVANSGTLALEGTPDPSVGWDGTGSRPLVANEGVILKRGGAGGSDVEAMVDNDGTIRSASGSLRFLGGTTGSVSTGAFGADDGARLEFDGDFSELGEGARIEGPGVVRFADGTVRCSGTVTVTQDGHVELARAFMGGHDVVVNGLVDVIDGGFGTSTIAPGGRLNVLGDGDSYLSGTIQNQGRFVWSGSADINRGVNGEVTIVNSGSFEVPDDGFPPNYARYLGGTLHNSGTVHIADRGIVWMNDLVNQASVELGPGTLGLLGRGSVASTGAYRLSGGAVLEYLDGFHLLGDGVSFTGDGRVLVTWGTLETAGTVNVGEGTTLQLSGGWLAGHAELEGAGAFVWNGGNMDPAAALQLGPSISAELIGNNYLSGTATIVNQGILGIDGVLGKASGQSPQLINEGTIVQRGVGSAIQMPLRNLGILSVPTGALLVTEMSNYDSSTATLSGGTFRVAGALRIAGAEIRRNDSALILEGGQAQVTDQAGNNALDSLAANSSKLSLREGATVTTLQSLANSGDLSLGQASVLTVGGDFSQASPGRLLIELTQTPSGPRFGRLSVAGSASLGGQLVLEQAGPPVPLADIVSYAAHTGTFDVQGLTQPDGTSYELHYRPTEVRLLLPEDVPPTNPALYSSHPVGSWGMSNEIEMRFSGAADNSSGVEGFSFEWSRSGDTVPDDVIDAPASAVATTSPTLPNGDSHYFHLRTVDRAGNWSDPIHMGPFWVDGSPPSDVSVEGPMLTHRFQRSTKLELAWTATDRHSGIQNIDVYQYRAAFNEDRFIGPQLWRSTRSPGSGVYRADPGTTVCFRADAQDNVYQWSRLSSPRCTAFPLNNTQLSHRGPWTKKSGDGYYLGSYSETTRRGAALLRPGIRAKRLALVATRCPGCGTVRVSWNGRLLKTVKLGSTRTLKRRVIDVARFSAVRRGSVTIKVVSSRAPVRIEGLGVSRS